MIDPRNLIAAAQAMDPRVLHKMALALRDEVSMRPPDTNIGGGPNGTYMHRWFVIPRNEHGFNIYLHRFARSDEDRALHDHPWANLSYIIEGEYMEQVPRFEQEPSGERITIHRKAGDFAFRKATDSHRVELFPKTEGPAVAEPELLPVWSLFMTGPKVRDWGFHCPKGWLGWREFTGQTEVNGVYTEGPNRGCGET